MIRGEKVFTNKVRAAKVREFTAAAARHTREARRLSAIAAALQMVSSTEELQRIEQTAYSDDPRLREFCFDDRHVCHACKRKVHGGVGGLILSDPDRFYCFRKACMQQEDRDGDADRRAHPKLYAAEKRRDEARRKREMRLRYGRNRMRRRS